MLQLIPPRASPMYGPPMYGLEALLAGRTLADRYRIEDVIGRGGMGAVYRATDERLGRAVAVKVISASGSDVAAHERLRARFVREAQVAAGLHHPNVVQVYDFGLDPALGLDFLVMQLLRGEDLAARLRRGGPPPIGEAVHILCSAARGLAAGHRAGLVHRDVKPGNLFLDAGDEPGRPHLRVLDFGIADLVSDEHTVTSLTGWGGRSPFSPAFASPEQLRGETRLGPATDVFSLAAVGFLLLTGERAFAAVEPERQAAELSAALTRLRTQADLPVAIRSVLERALAHRPGDRFPHAGALADALTAALGLATAGRAPDLHRADPVANALAEEPTPVEPHPLVATRHHEELRRARSGWGRPGDPGRGADSQSADGPPARASVPAPAWHGEGVRIPVESYHSRAPATVRGGFVHGVRSAISTTITTGVAAAFGTLWYGLAQQPDGLLDWRSYLLSGAATLVAPLLGKRLAGRGGSYRLGLVLSAATLWGTFHYAMPEMDDHTALVLTPPAQLTLCTGIARLMRQRRPGDSIARHSYP